MPRRRPALLALVLLALLPCLAPASARAVTGGQFSVACGYSHSASDDPIVKPRQPGAAHSHDFAGARTTNAFSSTSSLLAGGTSCGRPDDRSGYWVPSLYQNGVVAHARDFRLYYRGSGFDGAVVRPFPQGLRVVAGDARVTDAGPFQPVGVVSWACTINGGGAAGDEQEVQSVPSSCGGLPLRARIVFPQCWDGRNLDSVDHMSHMAYASRGKCPTGYPVVVPQLTMSIRYWLPTTASIVLSSGGTHSLHADFMTAWRNGTQGRLVANCIGRGVNCGETATK